MRRIQPRKKEISVKPVKQLPPLKNNHQNQGQQNPVSHQNNGAPCPLLLNLSSLYVTGKEFSTQTTSPSSSPTSLLAVHDALRDLNKNTHSKSINSSTEVKSFIIHSIQEVLQFMGEGIQSHQTNDLLYKSTHQILLFIQKKVLCWTNNGDIINLFNSFKEFLIILRNTRLSSGSDLYLNIIYWENDSQQCETNHGGEFAFCENNDEAKVCTLSYENFSKLEYCTSPQQLAKILLGATADGITINEDITTNNGDICTQGLLYCDVDTENCPYKKEGRIGSAVIKFNLSDITKQGGDSTTNFYKLGTKQYAKEYAQLLLLSDRVGNEWWLVEEGVVMSIDAPVPSPPKRPRTGNDSDDDDDEEEKADNNNNNAKSVQKAIRKLEPIDILEFEWNLKYCEEGSYNCENQCWTHPQIVIEGALTLGMINFKIVFEYDHKCTKCKECEIRKNSGRCYLQTEKCGWIEEGGAKYRDYDLPLILFAESVPIKEREKIRQLQSDYKIFDVDQFDIIQHCWEDNKDLWVMNWSLTCPIEL